MQKISKLERQRRNKMFAWTIAIIISNLAWFIQPSVIIQSISLFITVYGLYLLSIKDNPKNPKSKYYQSNY